MFGTSRKHSLGSTDKNSHVSYPDGEVAFSFSYGFFIGLPLMGSTGLRHVGGLLPAQALTQFVHLHALKLSVAEESQKEDAIIIRLLNCSIVVL